MCTMQSPVLSYYVIPPLRAAGLWPSAFTGNKPWNVGIDHGFVAFTPFVVALWLYLQYTFLGNVCTSTTFCTVKEWEGMRRQTSCFPREVISLITSLVFLNSSPPPSIFVMWRWHRWEMVPNLWKLMNKAGILILIMVKRWSVNHDNCTQSALKN